MAQFLRTLTLRACAGPALLVAALLAAPPAQAFPWDWDMVDATYVRAYELAMKKLPDGAVTMDRYVANFDRMTPEGQALANPLSAASPEVMKTGERMFGIYCVACHGPEGKGGAPVMLNDPAAGIKRYPVPPPMLSGDGAITANRSDGYIYLTVRNGGAIMPAYGASIEDAEIWSVVAYLRTLPGAAYRPPAPTEPPQ